MAAARRRVEWAKKKPKRAKSATYQTNKVPRAFPGFKTELVNDALKRPTHIDRSQDSFDEAMEELENSKLLEAELELKRRDTQLIAEFISAVDTIKPTQRHGQHLTVPWSQVEAIVTSLIRLRWLETK